MSFLSADSKMAQFWWENITKSLESLPVELQRNFTLMRDLDARAEGVLKEIDRLGDEFLRTASSITMERRRDIQSKLIKAFNKAKEYGDDKVQLAIQTYELVDKHIRRLDSDLARLESDIKNGTAGISLTSPSPESPADKSSKRGRKREKTTEPTSSSGTPSTSKKSKPESEEKMTKCGSTSPNRKKHKSEIQIAAEQVAAVGPQEAAMDMPVDPNEPTYCVCHQVSYGQMIACDNSECTIEWFHIGCMGLQSIPKGKWYCPKCQPLRKK